MVQLCRQHGAHERMNSLPLVLLPLLNISKPLRLMPWWVWFVHAKGDPAEAMWLTLRRMCVSQGGVESRPHAWAAAQTCTYMHTQWLLCITHVYVCAHL